MHIHVYLCTYVQLYISQFAQRNAAEFSSALGSCAEVITRRAEIMAIFFWQLQPAAFRVSSPISKLNRLSSSLGLFCHVPLKRDQLD